MAALSPGSTVLVTGASGAIGERVLRALAAEGMRTRALVHRRAAPGAGEEARGDLSDAESLRVAAQGAEGVLHMAAITHSRRPARYREINRDGTAGLVGAAREAGIERFVHVSTRAIAAEGGAYSNSKREAEELVGRSGLDHVIVRLPEVIGTRGREGVDGVIDRARRGARIPVVGSGEQPLCPIAVDDAVAALVAALSSDRAGGRTFTLAGECLSEREFAEACIRAFGSSSEIVSVPVPAIAAASVLARVAPLPIYPDQLARHRAPKPGVSPEARAGLGFSPTSLDQVLERLAAPG